MQVIRLRTCDDSLAKFEEEWSDQCNQVEDCYTSYATAPLSVIRAMAEEDNDKEWAIGIEHDGRFMAAACAIRAAQKGYSGHVLRIREVTVCPLLDYGKLDENAYSGTLIGILNGALKLSESDLKADHIKLHLRSPADSVFFRAFGNTLDSKGVFAATEAHGAWLTVSKASPLLIVK